MSIDDRGLTLVPATPEPATRRSLLPVYTHAVCVAIRIVLVANGSIVARAEAERPLDLAGREMLEHAMELIAEHRDMLTQVHAAAG